MNLEPLAEKITLIHRRDVFRAHEESIDWLLNRSKVDVRLWHELRRVEGNAHLERAVIFQNKTDEETCLDVDVVLLNLGFSADIGPVKEWGLALQGNGILVNQRMETNLPGVYAAGDIAEFDGKIDLIATGVGEICIAVNYAKSRIDPKAKVFPGHSSNMSLGSTGRSRTAAARSCRRRCCSLAPSSRGERSPVPSRSVWRPKRCSMSCSRTRGGTGTASIRRPTSTSP